MENFAFYSHQLAFDKVLQIVQTHLPKAQISLEESNTNRTLTATLKGGLFSRSKTLTIACRTRPNPSYTLEQIEDEFTHNLAGMASFVEGIVTTHTNIQEKLVHKILSINTEFSFKASPKLSKEFQVLLPTILLELDAIVFADPTVSFSRSNTQQFLDKHLNLILDRMGDSEIEDLEIVVNPKYMDQTPATYSAEQLDRKARSEEYLMAHEVSINHHLPCTPVEENVTLRAVEQVVERAYALLLTALKGEGAEQELLEHLIADKNIAITSLSAQEQYIHQQENLNNQERAYATWRYESLQVLLWALGLLETLPYPDQICEVPKVVESMAKLSKTALEAKVQMRDKKVILEELDKVYRMHWACVNARIKEQPVAGNLEAGVVYERHYALNWLTNHQNQAWDAVQTNT